MSVFKFKHFEVDQQGCAMRINTDGVLLGAMAHHNHAKTILDIGTGTGVIALMLAQRFKNAKIHAIEIDETTASAAANNFKNAPFSSRLTAQHISLSNFSTVEKFDLIVSNPPFFINDLRNPEVKKGIARHTDNEFFDTLVQCSCDWLSENGKLWLILPPKQASYVIEKSMDCNLSLCEVIDIHSDKSKETFRQIICLGKGQCAPLIRDFYIYEAVKTHTKAYEELLSDFFLAY
ncbi:tRNA1(Val) (adenine(37)-N6)-methyltransferase [Pedobacter sp. AW1-32]|uniref:tRNA1(Val) (adenine(37)-N6)-methyltransferase n=1 Tax=Pedobacter sp. AW1-32 TaxID=3383026 RepID=UPI003FEE5B96